MYQLNPAVLNSDQNISESKINTNMKKITNRTYKNKKNVKFDTDKERKPKLTNINNLLHSSIESDDEDNDMDFTMQYTSLLNDKNITDNITNSNNINEDLINAEHKKMNKFHVKNHLGNLDNITYSNLKDSYKPNINYLNNNNNPVNTMDFHNNESHTIDNNNKLLSKLDYIIHLLEEQHNEKTNHITEELILYLFLGIFMIYVLDSFTKASKYIR